MNDYTPEEKEFIRLEKERDEALATITELRAACAEKDIAIVRAMESYELARLTRDNPTYGGLKSALSSHGESILADIARLKKEIATVRVCFAEASHNAGPAFVAHAELSALRARAESAVAVCRSLRTVVESHLQYEELSSMDREALRLASDLLEPPQQGDKEP